MLNHPLLAQLDAALVGIVPVLPVEVRGEWTMTSRRTYQSGGQEGTGSGPFVDVVDERWRGVLTAATPIGGIAFLSTPRALHWIKVPEASATLGVGISLSAYAGHHPERATFAPSVAGAHLPGVSVRVDADLTSACILGPSMVSTARSAVLAGTESARFLVLLLQRDLLKFGRSRLWRLRDEVASSLPPAVRELLTQRRTGVFPA